MPLLVRMSAHGAESGEENKGQKSRKNTQVRPHRSISFVCLSYAIVAPRWPRSYRDTNPESPQSDVDTRGGPEKFRRSNVAECERHHPSNPIAMPSEFNCFLFWFHD